MKNKPVDLQAIAKKAMEEKGFAADFSKEAKQETLQMKNQPSLHPTEEVLDLRSLLWSSIDNIDSQDLDQIEYAERLPKGGFRLRVGIADVDAFVKLGSAVDKHAETNTTSVYTGVMTFPMLPREFSEDSTSLAEGQERLAVVVDMQFDEGANLQATEIILALVRNHAKLVYEQVAAFLEGKESDHVVLQDPTWATQIRLQDELAQKLRSHRFEQGALDLETIEARPIVDHGAVTTLEISRKNRARELIEDFMIATNTAVVRFLKQRNTPIIRRIVREPSRWVRIVQLAYELGENLPETPNSSALAAFLAKQRTKDPERFPDLSLTIVKLIGKGEYVVESPGEPETGHFGLAVSDYTHSTAPNRRFPDLVTQRLLKACLLGKKSPYSARQLHALAFHCTEKSNDAQKVERFVRKAAAAVFLRPRIGEWFEGIVTGASGKGTYVRLLDPPVEGRVVENERGLDVGNKVSVKLIGTSPENGHIDFSAAKQ